MTTTEKEKYKCLLPSLTSGEEVSRINDSRDRYSTVLFICKHGRGSHEQSFFASMKNNYKHITDPEPAQFDPTELMQGI